MVWTKIIVVENCCVSRVNVLFYIGVSVLYWLNKI